MKRTKVWLMVCMLSRVSIDNPKQIGIKFQYAVFKKVHKGVITKRVSFVYDAMDCRAGRMRIFTR